MKTLICLFLVYFANLAAASQPAEMLNISCRVDKHPSQSLIGVGYGTKDQVEYAVIKLVSGKDNQKVISEYTLNYEPAKGPSFYYNFSNEKGVRLEVMTDDMGGMSALHVGNNQIDLTCSLDNF